MASKMELVEMVGEAWGGAADHGWLMGGAVEQAGYGFGLWEVEDDPGIRPWAIITSRDFARTRRANDDEEAWKREAHRRLYLMAKSPQLLNALAHVTEMLQTVFSDDPVGYPELGAAVPALRMLIGMHCERKPAPGNEEFWEKVARQFEENGGAVLRITPEADDEADRGPTHDIGGES